MNGCRGWALSAINQNVKVGDKNKHLKFISGSLKIKSNGEGYKQKVEGYK